MNLFTLNLCFHTKDKVKEMKIMPMLLKTNNNFRLLTSLEFCLTGTLSKFSVFNVNDHDGKVMK